MFAAAREVQPAGDPALSAKDAIGKDGLTLRPYPAMQRSSDEAAKMQEGGGEAHLRVSSVMPCVMHGMNLACVWDVSASARVRSFEQTSPPWGFKALGAPGS
jgi:hypothetical protein